MLLAYDDDRMIVRKAESASRYVFGGERWNEEKDRN